MTSPAYYILTECFIDTNLIETLGEIIGCNHQKGCNQVAKIMKEKFADRFAVGVIDADKRKPSYLLEFNLVCSSKHIQVLHHSTRPHYMILISPAADGFILSCAQSAGVDLGIYGLPSKLNEFLIQTKNVMSSRDIRFKNLFKDTKEFGEMSLLKELVSYFTRNTYTTTEADLRKLFSTT